MDSTPAHADAVTTPATPIAVRTVLVAVGGVPADTALLEAGMAVCRCFGAHLQALFTHIDPEELAIRMGAWDPMGAAGFGAAIDDLMKDADAREAAARQTFDQTCGTAGLSAEFIVGTGVDSECVIKYGRAADLIVFVRDAVPEDTAYPMLE